MILESLNQSASRRHISGGGRHNFVVHTEMEIRNYLDKQSSIRVEVPGDGLKVLMRSI